MCNRDAMVQYNVLDADRVLTSPQYWEFSACAALWEAAALFGVRDD
jgi:hypothetical protein